MASLSFQERAAVQFAKSLVDMREYGRVEDQLCGYESQISVFLTLYAKYMTIEQSFGTLGNVFKTVESADSNETYLDQMAALMKRVRSLPGALLSDPYIQYLHALILIRQKLTLQAIPYLVQSIQGASWNWGAWKALQSCVKSSKRLTEFAQQLPKDVPTYLFFLCSYTVQNHIDSDAGFTLLEELQNKWPYHPLVKLFFAVYHYHKREFNISQSLFDEYYLKNPNSLEFVDIYSNVLFLRDESAQLALLAQKCTRIGKYRPETCCVIANFYSLKNEHEKAITYFKRALKLSHEFNGAWTLMGHEYMEVGNTKAALECYRRAVEVDDRDFRAWFGLGQTYEILGMLSFSFFYYQKAVALRPKDTRFWTCMAGVLENMGQQENALKCYKKATAKYLPEKTQLASFNNLEDETGGEFAACLKVWYKIAKLYSSAMKYREAVKWFESALQFDTLLKEELTPAEFSETLIYVSKHYISIGNKQTAEKYLFQMIDSDLPDRDEAKTLLRDLQYR